MKATKSYQIYQIPFQVPQSTCTGMHAHNYSEFQTDTEVTL